MRVSNEPCTDRSSNARRELAHERAFDGLAVYGECRDSERTLHVREPVGMAHCKKSCTDRSSNARRELARKLPYPIDKEIEIEYDT